MGKKLAGLDWLNLGGGYLFNQIEDNKSFIELVAKLKADFNLDVYIEPGSAVVGKAGYLIATVLDSFTSDGKTVAILDTSVNHHPQIFEYQRKPELHGHDSEGRYPVILTGNTCLAGDLFGEYLLDKPLQVGEKVVFEQVGAYSLVKANRFNGYNLPDVYLANGKQIRLVKHYDYQGYRQQWQSDV
jgi:carboxynorspermidine decarboxylase